MAKKRRGNGEGSIFQRSNGLWVATITVGYDAKGRRKRRDVYGKTKREVQEKLTRLQSAKLDGTLGDPCKLTVAEYLKTWLEDSARPTIRETTHQSYESVIRVHINPRIGGVKLTKLSPIQVQGLYSDMEKAGKSPRLRQLCHAVLRRALKQAVRWGMLPRNVCDAVDPPRVENTEINPLTPEQVIILLEAAAGDRLYALYATAVGASLRFGELAGLSWSDIDFSAGTLTVRRKLQELNGKLTLNEPKTKKSRRQVDLPRFVIDALDSHRKLMMAEGNVNGDAVFCNTKGRFLRRTHFRDQQFKPLLKRAGLPDIRFHDLRHTSATLLLAQGVHPKIVQERLGHSQISMTLDTYSHVLPTMQKEAAGKLDEIVSQADKRRKKGDTG